MTRAQKRGKSVRPSKTVASRAPGGQPTWLVRSRGGLPGRAEQVGSQAEEQPTELPGGSQPPALRMGQAPANDWEAKELPLAPEGGRSHKGRGPTHGPPTQEGDPCGQSPRGHTHSCSCAPTREGTQNSRQHSATGWVWRQERQGGLARRALATSRLEALPGSESKATGQAATGRPTRITPLHHLACLLQSRSSPRPPSAEATPRPALREGTEAIKGRAR